MMNIRIIQFLRDVIDSKEMSYTRISEESGIEYQRLMKIFNQYVTISGSELLCLCKVLEVNQAKLMALLEGVT